MSEPRSPRAEPPNPAVELRLGVATLVRALFGVVALLAVANAASVVLRLNDYPTGFGLVALFNSDIELSVPTWFSAVLLLACAVVLFLIARVPSEGWRRNWLALAVIFVLMSIDEVAAYHEYWTGVLRDALDTGGLLYAAWVVPAMILVAILAVTQIPFLRALPRTTALRFVAAGGLYVSGALGLEMLAASYAETRGGENATYLAIAAVEEILEMVASVLFLRALLLHLAASGGDVRITTTTAG